MICLSTMNFWGGLLQFAIWGPAVEILVIEVVTNLKPRLHDKARNSTSRWSRLSPIQQVPHCLDSKFSILQTSLGWFIRAWASSHQLSVNHETSNSFGSAKHEPGLSESVTVYTTCLSLYAPFLVNHNWVEFRKALTYFCSANLKLFSV